MPRFAQCKASAEDRHLGAIEPRFCRRSRGDSLFMRFPPVLTVTGKSVCSLATPSVALWEIVSEESFDVSSLKFRGSGNSSKAKVQKRTPTTRLTEY